ncbi:MAG: acetylxylan esterase, partial [Verrucomicrobiae bacterium]|nr:acetylxylan esterase [Verrucomicrobiae bacterium]
MKLILHVVCGGVVFLALAEPGRAAEINYDESKVPKYVLPDPLRPGNGKPVRSSTEWLRRGRPITLKLFEEHVYGRAPGKPNGTRFRSLSVDDNALGGTAIRKEVEILLLGKEESPSLELLVYIPKGAAKPVPVFLGLNFSGNQSVHPDPGIRITQRWVRNTGDGTVVNNRATEKSRGCQSTRWAIEKALSRGFAVATFYYGDVEPDHPEGWKTGIRAALSKDGPATVFKPDEWGALAAWAWGLSRAMDYIERDRMLDSKRVVLFGHSRHGKAALWAGAVDRRFAIVISNNSGCGGAALSRRRFGENVDRINTVFPHWF